MPHPATVTLSPMVISQLEPLADETHASIETLVNEAVVEYLRLRESREMGEELARQYGELADMWDELTEELADERWLAVENEALLQFEHTLAE